MPWINHSRAKYPHDVVGLNKLLTGCKIVSQVTRVTGRIEEVIPHRSDEYLIVIDWDNRLDKSYWYPSNDSVHILIPSDRMSLCKKLIDE